MAGVKRHVAAMEAELNDDADELDLEPNEYELCIVNTVDEQGQAAQRQISRSFYCNGFGLRFRNCTEKRTIFCMYCGKKIMTIRICTKERCQSFHKG